MAHTWPCMTRMQKSWPYLESSDRLCFSLHQVAKLINLPALIVQSKSCWSKCGLGSPGQALGLQPWLRECWEGWPHSWWGCTLGGCCSCCWYLHDVYIMIPAGFIHQCDKATREAVCEHVQALYCQACGWNDPVNSAARLYCSCACCPADKNCQLQYKHGHEA